MNLQLDTGQEEAETKGLSISEQFYDVINSALGLGSS